MWGNSNVDPSDIYMCVAVPQNEGELGGYLIAGKGYNIDFTGLPPNPERRILVRLTNEVISVGDRFKSENGFAPGLIFANSPGYGIDSVWSQAIADKETSLEDRICRIFQNPRGTTNLFGRRYILICNASGDTRRGLIHRTMHSARGHYRRNGTFPGFVEVKHLPSDGCTFVNIDNIHYEVH